MARVGYCPIQEMGRRADDLYRRLGRSRPLTAAELASQGRVSTAGVMIQDVVGDVRAFKDTETGASANCTCRYVGTHCYVYVGDDQISNAEAVAMGQFFDETIYPKAHAYFGSEWNPGIDGDSHVYVVFSSLANGNAYFDASNEYPISADNSFSNLKEMVMIDGRMSFPQFGPMTFEDLKGIVAHEFQHLVRWSTKLQGSSFTGIDAPSSRDKGVNEGCSQLMECLVGYGYRYGPTFSVASRSQNLKEYLESTESVSLSGHERGGARFYSAGLLAVLYLVDHFGPDSEVLPRLGASDGRVGMDSLAAASGLRASDFFDRLAWALRFAATPGMDPAYTFRSIDLTGRTQYAGTPLHAAWACMSNLGPADYAQGWDLSRSAWTTPNTAALLEWAPQFHRFYNGRGQTLEIELADLKPSGAGGGDVSVYLLCR